MAITDVSFFEDANVVEFCRMRCNSIGIYKMRKIIDKLFERKRMLKVVGLRSPFRDKTMKYLSVIRFSL